MSRALADALRVALRIAQAVITKILAPTGVYKRVDSDIGCWTGSVVSAVYKNSMDSVVQMV